MPARDVRVRRGRRGLTFVELLVTVSLVVLTVAAVTATLSGGISVWQRAHAQGGRTQWLDAATHQLDRDLSRARRFAPVAFEGGYDEWSFPALVPSEQPQADDLEELGRVTYYFDAPSRTLCRAQIPYRRLGRARAREACSPVLTDLDRIQMSYFGSRDGRQSASWHPAWKSKDPPAALRIELGFTDRLTRRSSRETLLVRLPLGQSALIGKAAGAP